MIKISHLCEIPVHPTQVRNTVDDLSEADALTIYTQVYNDMCNEEFNDDPSFESPRPYDTYNQDDYRDNEAEVHVHHVASAEA